VILPAIFHQPLNNFFSRPVMRESLQVRLFCFSLNVMSVYVQIE
jgi:hypothetical protein